MAGLREGCQVDQLLRHVDLQLGVGEVDRGRPQDGGPVDHAALRCAAHRQEVLGDFGRHGRQAGGFCTRSRQGSRRNHDRNGKGRRFRGGR